jgi:hypothetical protein
MIKKFKNPNTHFKHINENNLGSYIPYSLNDPTKSYEYLSETSILMQSYNRDINQNNLFKWNIRLNRIKDVLYAYTHYITISLYPWLDKNNYDLDINIKSYLINNFSNFKIDQNIIIDIITIQITYIDNEIIDFYINEDTTKLYSFNKTITFLYTRSNKKILSEPFLYLDLDPNDLFNNNNVILTTNDKNKKFIYKIAPILMSKNYVYYNGLKQFIFNSVNDLKHINGMKIKLYGSDFKEISNNNINYKADKNIYCNCLTEEKFKPSCYCNYIRHPLHKDNQVDIALKIGIVKNELITKIFH